MRRLMVLAASVAVALVGVGCGGSAKDETSAPTQAATQGRWVIKDLGTLGEYESVANDINERGQIVGWAGVSPDEFGQAVLWQGGKARKLGSLGGEYSSAMAINDRGQIVGWTETTRRAQNCRGGGCGTHALDSAFLWQNGKMRDLGTLGGEESKATAINNRGQIVGAAEVNRKNSRAFLWQGGRMRDLGSLHGRSSEATSINEAGQVVGLLDGGHAFLWQKGRMRDVSKLGGAQTELGAINNRGQIVGSAFGDKSHPYAFLWQNGKMRELGTLGGTNSWATDINERGQIVGASGKWVKGWGPYGRMHAFVWQAGKMTDLGTLPGGNLYRSEALAINERGQIVGWSETRRSDPEKAVNGVHAVLWTYKP